MSRTVWRIGTDTRGYQADDLSGEGAKRSGGRWNDRDAPVVYASESRALACLETIVHLNAGGLPLNRYLVRITVTDQVWDRALRRTAPDLPVGWDAEPAGQASVSFGTQWLRAGGSALLIVPSVIVEEEFNVLINPLHPDRSGLTAAKIRKWRYDPRLTNVAV